MLDRPSRCPPPGRSNTPAAIRARRSKARLGKGVRTYRVRAHTRRLTAALLNPYLSELDTPDQVEAELDDELRAIIREEVAFPEHVEIEIERQRQLQAPLALVLAMVLPIESRGPSRFCQQKSDAIVHARAVEWQPA
jgi:hypothetical protein